MAVKKEVTEKSYNPFEDPNYNPFDDKVVINIPAPSEALEGQGEFVAVNEYNAYIKYGEDVEVPRFVLDLLNDKKVAMKIVRANQKKFAQ